jgi:hypothetical protein
MVVGLRGAELDTAPQEWEPWIAACEALGGVQGLVYGWGDGVTVLACFVVICFGISCLSLYRGGSGWQRLQALLCMIRTDRDRLRTIKARLRAAGVGFGAGEDDNEASEASGAADVSAVVDVSAWTSG